MKHHFTDPFHFTNPFLNISSLTWSSWLTAHWKWRICKTCNSLVVVLIWTGHTVDMTNPINLVASHRGFNGVTGWPYTHRQTHRCLQMFTLFLDSVMHTCIIQEILDDYTVGFLKSYMSIEVQACFMISVLLHSTCLHSTYIKSKQQCVIVLALL